MVRYWQIVLLVLVAVLLAGCGVLDAPERMAGSRAAKPTVALGGLVELEGPLTVRAYNKDRAVQADSDESFDFLMVNTTDQLLSVVIVLEHSDGQRWRTSLCVEKQCLLGDGSEPSVTEPVTLPPYLEQPFQAHLFVDEAAKPGHQSTLTLRVEPQTPDIEAQSLTLSAQLASE